jgi:hypothetical protein
VGNSPALASLPADTAAPVALYSCGILHSVASDALKIINPIALHKSLTCR